METEGKMTHPTRRIVYALPAVVGLAGVVAYVAYASGRACTVGRRDRRAYGYVA
jgi:uncharacterized membrane protein YuzA (DUF378 family)